MGRLGLVQTRGRDLRVPQNLRFWTINPRCAAEAESGRSLLAH